MQQILQIMCWNVGMRLSNNMLQRADNKFISWIVKPLHALKVDNRTIQTRNEIDLMQQLFRFYLEGHQTPVIVFE